MTSTPVTHVIFDLDGLLIDTECWSVELLIGVLTKHDIEVSRESIEQLCGVQPLERCETIVQKHGITTITGKELFKEWYADALLNLDTIKLMPGAEKLLRHLHLHQIPMAIATSGYEADFKAKTNHLPILCEPDKFFCHVLSCDDPAVGKPKPAPDIYQVCCQRFKDAPEDVSRVLAFEDSLPGVEAAKAAGLKCVLVSDKRLNGGVKSDKADLVLNSLEEFRPEMFGLPGF